MTDRSRQALRTAWLCLGFAGVLAAQQPASVAGPTSGLVYDQAAGVLRPVLGLPGGATFGTAIPLNYPAAWVVVSPRLDSAVVAAQDGSLHFLALGAAGITELSVPGITEVPQRVVYSPSGTSAALLYTAQAQVITGLPTAPVAGRVLPLEVSPTRQLHPAPQALASVALSDDGAVLLEARGGSVRLAGTGGRSNLMSGMLAAFAPGSHDAAIADGAGVTLVRAVDGAAERTVLSDSGVPQPVGLAFSSDGATVFAAVPTGVVALATSGGAPSQVACACSPAGITAMGRVFRLTELGQGPMWLLDPGNSSPRTVFVPALR